MSRESVGYAIIAVAGLAYTIALLVASRRARAVLRATSVVQDRQNVVSDWVKATSRAVWAIEAAFLVAACVMLSADPRELVASGWLLIAIAMFFWLTSGSVVRKSRRWAPLFLGIGFNEYADESDDRPA